MPTFDSTVFDVAVFDASYNTPLLRNVVVEPEYTAVTAGQHIVIKAHIMQVDSTYGRRYDLSPEGGVLLEVHNPDGSITLPFTQMANMATGRYITSYPTLIGDQQGYYTGRVKAINGDKVLVSRRMGLFTLLTQDTLQVFDPLVLDPAVFDTQI